MSGDRQRAALRYTTRREKRSNLAPPCDEPWMWLPRSLLTSPAFAGLSRIGFMVLARLCIENMDHAGRENGHLAVSYNDLVAFGIERRSIAKALDELDALGFVRRTEQGRKAYGADPGRVATYRLTFAGTVGDAGAAPTNDWKRITAKDVERVGANLAKRRRGRKVDAPAEAQVVPLHKPAAARRRAL